MQLEPTRSREVQTQQKLATSLVLLLVMCYVLCVSPVFAFDPSAPNNKVGIHLAVPQEDDIRKAAELVNSSGGKWGYVTLVMQENDRNSDKWQAIFDLLRQEHLIPIIRLATQPDGGNWRKPTVQDADDWANFLNSLNWVVKDRYIVLFNEPNHGQEWGGSVDASDYAKVADAFAQKLKSKSSDFYVMLAGMDSSAPNQGSLLEDESPFLSQMKDSAPDLFDHIDGWTSHSYPNPGFAGSPTDFGRGTVQDYDWELSQIRQLGVTKDLPVFITETGWSSQAVSPDQIGADFVQAYQGWLADSRVRAVTPFVLSYQSEPFLNFSWKKYLSNDFYPQFDAVKAISKVSGEPEQVEKGEIEMTLPNELLVDSSYHFFIPIHNRGQAIWDREDGYQMRLITKNFEDYFVADIHQIHPGDSAEADIFIKTGSKVGDGVGDLGLYKGEKKILGAPTWRFTMLPLPSLKLQAKTFPRGWANGDDFSLQVFDQKEQLVFKQSQIFVKNGKGTVAAIHNIYLGGTYRVVLLKPYYLPRQQFVTFKKGENTLKFKVMLPLDFNKDGTFNWKDIVALITQPSLLKVYGL